MVERQFNTKVKIIRSNNAFELGTRTVQKYVLLLQGIIHQTTCTSTPQQME